MTAVIKNKPLTPLSQRDRILSILKERSVVTNRELNYAVGFRYGARIHELRQRGYHIATERVGRGGLFKYTYHGR